MFYGLFSTGQNFEPTLAIFHAFGQMLVVVNGPINNSAIWSHFWRVSYRFLRTDDRRHFLINCFYLIAIRGRESLSLAER